MLLFIIILCFLESISNPLQIEKTCSQFLQAQHGQFPYIVSTLNLNQTCNFIFIIFYIRCLSEVF